MLLVVSLVVTRLSILLALGFYTRFFRSLANQGINLLSVGSLEAPDMAVARRCLQVMPSFRC